MKLYFTKGTSPKCQCCPHIETSQLICFANQLTGIYMRATLAFNGLSSISPEILRKPLVNIPLIVTIDPCVENLYRNQVHVDKLLEMKMLESFFTFDQKYYKLCDDFAIGSPLGSTSANVLMCHFEKICLENYPFQFKAVAYRRYVDDMILLFRSAEHVKTFQKYLNK